MRGGLLVATGRSSRSLHSSSPETASGPLGWRSSTLRSSLTTWLSWLDSLRAADREPLGRSGASARSPLRFGAVSAPRQRPLSAVPQNDPMNTTPDITYPVRFSVDYPERRLNKLTTAFRLVVAIPILFVLAAVSGSTWQWSYEAGSTAATGAGGLLFFGPLLMILFRQKYPRWWFDFNLELQRFTNRTFAYLALMDDRYPSTTDEQSVSLEYDYPDVERDLNRWLPLVKWFLAIPHYLALLILGIVAVFAVVAAWLTILFTGRYPRAIFDFVEGVMRWENRVSGYAFTLVTDRYPPFRLS